MSKVKIIRDGAYVEIDKAELDLPEPVGLRRASLYKTDIYSRMNDEELEKFDSAMRLAPLRTRKMWDDCLQVEVNSDLFPILKARLENDFGKAEPLQSYH